LNFLEKSSRPDIVYAVHQCARFAANPRTCHKHAILRIGRYLMNTKHMGMTMRPNNNPLELWCDAEFCGNGDQLTAGSDRSTSKSRTGFIITYAGCPLTWSSRMQTETALSTTEAEGLRTTIPIMSLIEELREEKVVLSRELSKVRCKVFEDNIGAKTNAIVPRYRPRTKHINIKYWHFIEHMEKGLIDIQSVKSEDQLADILTKPLPESEFTRLRDIILGIHPNHNHSTFQGSAKEKATNDAGNAEGEIGSAQHEKGGGAARQHSAKAQEDHKKAALHDKSE